MLGDAAVFSYKWQVLNLMRHGYITAWILGRHELPKLQKLQLHRLPEIIHALAILKTFLAHKQ